MNKRARVFFLLATLLGASELSALIPIQIKPIYFNDIGEMDLRGLTKADYPIIHEPNSKDFGIVRNTFNNDDTSTYLTKLADLFLRNTNGVISILMLAILGIIWLCWLGNLSRPLSRIWPKAVKSKALPLVIVTLLTACGGGEENQSNTAPLPTTPTPPVPPTIPELQMSLMAITSMMENSSVDVPVTISGAQGDIRVLINHSGSEQLKVSEQITATGGILHLQLGELFSNQQAQVDLSITDANGRNKTVSVLLDLNNTQGFHGVIVNIPEVSLELVEHTSIDLGFIFDGASGDVQVSIASTTKEAEITTDAQLTNTGGTLSISAGELEYSNSALQLELTFTDSAGEQQIWVQDIALLNMSGEATLNAFNQVISATPAFINLKTERELVSRLSSLATMLNPSYTESEDALLTQFTQAIKNNGLINDITLWLSQRQDYEIRYQNGAITESDIAADHQALLTLLQQHSSAIDGVMLDAVDATGGNVPNIRFDGVYLDQASGRLSRFIGNPTLGHFQDQLWQFKADYQFLNAIVFPESQSCHPE
jgi:hypothetical protein